MGVGGRAGQLAGPWAGVPGAQGTPHTHTSSPHSQRLQDEGSLDRNLADSIMRSARFKGTDLDAGERGVVAGGGGGGGGGGGESVDDGAAHVSLASPPRPCLPGRSPSPPGAPPSPTHRCRVRPRRGVGDGRGPALARQPRAARGAREAAPDPRVQAAHLGAGKGGLQRCSSPDAAPDAASPCVHLGEGGGGAGAALLADPWCPSTVGCAPAGQVRVLLCLPGAPPPPHRLHRPERLPRVAPPRAPRAWPLHHCARRWAAPRAPPHTLPHAAVRIAQTLRPPSPPPTEHVPSSRQADEAVWTEMRNFKKCLIQMFMKEVGGWVGGWCGGRGVLALQAGPALHASHTHTPTTCPAQGKEVVFIETAMRLGDPRSHAVVECIPVPPEGE